MKHNRFKAIHSTHWQRTDNEIGDAGALSLSEALEINSTLTVLYLNRLRRTILFS